MRKVDAPDNYSRCFKCGKLGYFKKIFLARAVKSIKGASNIYNIAYIPANDLLQKILNELPSHHICSIVINCC